MAKPSQLLVRLRDALDVLRGHKRAAEWDSWYKPHTELLEEGKAYNLVGNASYGPISEPGKLIGFTWSGKASPEVYWQDANTGDEPHTPDLCACGCELHTPICECPQCRGKEQG